MDKLSPVAPLNSFVIRFWREWSATAGRWRGRIEHVQSGQHTDFVELGAILEFVRRFGVMTEARDPPGQGDQ
jgi:hypothetical protein